MGRYARHGFCPFAAVQTLLMIAAILIGSSAMSGRVHASDARSAPALTAMAGDHCAMPVDDHDERETSSGHRDLPPQQCAIACALVLPLMPQPAARSGATAIAPRAGDPAPLDSVMARLQLPPPRA